MLRTPTLSLPPMDVVAGEQICAFTGVVSRIRLNEDGFLSIEAFLP